MLIQQPDKTERILIVTPSPRTINDHITHLSRAGSDVTITTDEAESLARIATRAVEAVVLHVPADASTGVDFVAGIHQAYGAGCLPMLVLAPSADTADRCRFLDAGADDVVCETISPAELASRIGVLLRFKALHDELDGALHRERALLSELRRDNEQLQDLCATDLLTHLVNVRSFHGMLEHEFKVAKRYGQTISMLMIDIDHFKVINDTYGHPAGDYVLKELAVILTRSVRESDIVARIGGEEFAVVLPQTDTKRARRLAQRIRKEVCGHLFEVFGSKIHVTVSIGLVSWPGDAEITEHEMLYYFADQALLRAKDGGRDSVVCVDQIDMALRRRWRRDYRHQSLTPVEETAHSEAGAPTAHMPV